MTSRKNYLPQSGLGTDLMLLGSIRKTGLHLIQKQAGGNNLLKLFTRFSSNVENIFVLCVVGIYLNIIVRKLFYVG